jgi:hypothetical protein
MANILLVATGGTRAPTQLDLAERFTADGHAVRFLATPNALRFLSSHLVRRLHKLPAFVKNYRSQLRETLAYFIERPTGVPHISEGKWADVVVVAPATCNSISKLAAGMSDNYPLLVLRAVPRNKTVIIVPSMNPEMWFDPLFQRSIDLLNATEKYRVLSPQHGLMLSGDWGFGAQVAISDIIAETYRALGLVVTAPAPVKSLEPPAATAKPGVNPITQLSPQNHARLVHVDPDETTRRNLAAGLRRSYPDLEIESFSGTEAALRSLRDRPAGCVVTEIDFAQTSAGLDLIEQLRRPGSDTTQIIATSARDRQAVGAERLARLNVFFVPKPFNLGFIVGMIGGALRYGPQCPTAPVTRQLRSGEVLFREGDHGSEVFVVTSGRVRVTRRERGGEVELGIVEVGEMLGKMSFLDRAPRSATVTALEPSEVAVLDLERFRDYLEGQPSWLRCMIQSLSGHLRNSSAKLVSASAKAADGRARLVSIGSHPVPDQGDDTLPSPSLDVVS